MKVAGRTVLVTGGSDGIGRELVVSLLARGARVAVVGRSVERLRGTVVRAGYLADRLSTYAVDVTDRAAVESLPDAVIHAHGHTGSKKNSRSAKPVCLSGES